MTSKITGGTRIESTDATASAPVPNARCLTPEMGSGVTSQAETELRVALTRRCNYHCFFCHHEGQTLPCTDPVTAHQAVDLISREIANGVNDVTLTGGEPMLESDLVAGIVDGLARLSSSIVPALTIVSNGTLWDGGMIRRVASYPGPLKVNISVHTASPFLYDQVTATQGMRDQVINTVRALVAAGVRVKFNAAVMRGINASAGAMLSLLDQASTLGVTSVKFLELLRQANDPKSEALFVGCSEIEGTLQTLGFRRIREIARGVEMTRVDRSGIHAEVKRCSCALGCGRCQGALARNFGPDLKPHCCFWSERGGGGARCAETDRGGSAV